MFVSASAVAERARGGGGGPRGRRSEWTRLEGSFIFFGSLPASLVVVPDLSLDNNSLPNVMVEAMNRVRRVYGKLPGSGNFGC